MAWELGTWGREGRDAGTYGTRGRVVIIIVIVKSLFKHGKIHQEYKKNRNNLTILNKIQKLTTTNLTKTCFS